MSAEMIFPTISEAIISGLFGLGGMLVGGFVVYHRVESMFKNIRDEILRVDSEQKDELKQVWARFDCVQETKVCLAERRSCVVQFSGFREGQTEIKQLFRELQGDLKAELRLLRECITAVTAGKC